MGSSYHFSVEEAQYLGVASLITGAAFTAYSGELSVWNTLSWLAVSVLVILTRELGQRTLAEWIDAYVEVELSLEGATTTLVAAIFSVITSLPILLLFPLTNSFSGKKYEHWGKSIDAIWMKRQYWIACGGILALMAGWTLSYVIGLGRAAEGFALFSLFQLMPFDYEGIPTGCLDGAYILRWNAFYWLFLTGLSLLFLVVTV